MQTTDFIFSKAFQSIEKTSFSSSSPSNIALVKYWGKEDIQIPKNTSISFTLSNCKTETRLELSQKKEESQHIQVYLDKVETPSFVPKIQKFFKLIQSYCPYLDNYDVKVHTHNTFPHSSGIASSASGMSALALCIMQLEKQLDPQMDDSFFWQKTSFLARLGSGSACRSLSGGLVVWGEHQDIPNSSQLYGVAYKQNIHSDFLDFQDCILLVDQGEKKVSSTIGHSLMNGHPFAEKRFEQAEENISKIAEILQSGDLKSFIRLVESEALTLHGMMMTSNPYFILMSPKTLEAINAIWKFRDETKIPVCFTLDAGANVHVLYPKKHKTSVEVFIENELKQYCENGKYILDEVGNGASITN